jgi:zinc-ribbon domain
MPRAKCETCGAKLPAKSKFCPECGAPVASGDTVVQEVPPSEDGPAPVEQHVSQRQLFGVPPSSMLLGLGVVGLIAAVVLLATGNWPWALIALGVALFLFTGFLNQARRLPDDSGAPGRVSVNALSSVRSRAGAAKETIAAHGGARLELVRLRREISGLVRDRREHARELGEAVYAENEAAADDSKRRMKEIDDEIASKEGQMAQVTMDATNRIERAKMQVQPTEILPEGTEMPGTTPEPATVPEPSPPPDEGQPPEPAQVPEPYPPPDEGDRPQPPEIPEPRPDPGPN